MVENNQVLYPTLTILYSAVLLALFMLSVAGCIRCAFKRSVKPRYYRNGFHTRVRFVNGIDGYQIEYALSGRPPPHHESNSKSVGCFDHPSASGIGQRFLQTFAQKQNAERDRPPNSSLQRALPALPADQKSPMRCVALVASGAAGSLTRESSNSELYATVDKKVSSAQVGAQAAQVNLGEPRTTKRQNFGDGESASIDSAAVTLNTELVKNNQSILARKLSSSSSSSSINNHNQQETNHFYTKIDATQEHLYTKIRLENQVACSNKDIFTLVDESSCDFDPFYCRLTDFGESSSQTGNRVRSNHPETLAPPSYAYPVFNTAVRGRPDRKSIDKCFFKPIGRRRGQILANNVAQHNDYAFYDKIFVAPSDYCTAYGNDDLYSSIKSEEYYSRLDGLDEAEDDVRANRIPYSLDGGRASRFNELTFYGSPLLVNNPSVLCSVRHRPLSRSHSDDTEYGFIIRRNCANIRHPKRGADQSIFYSKPYPKHKFLRGRPNRIHSNPCYAVPFREQGPNPRVTVSRPAGFSREAKNTTKRSNPQNNPMASFGLRPRSPFGDQSEEGGGVGDPSSDESSLFYQRCMQQRKFQQNGGGVEPNYRYLTVREPLDALIARMNRQRAQMTSSDPSSLHYYSTISEHNYEIVPYIAFNKVLHQVPSAAKQPLSDSSVKDVPLYIDEDESMIVAPYPQHSSCFHPRIDVISSSDSAMPSSNQDFPAHNITRIRVESEELNDDVACCSKMFQSTDVQTNSLDSNSRHDFKNTKQEASTRNYLKADSNHRHRSELTFFGRNGVRSMPFSLRCKKCGMFRCSEAVKRCSCNKTLSD